MDRPNGFSQLNSAPKSCLANSNNLTANSAVGHTRDAGYAGSDGWPSMAKTVREYDEEKIKAYKDDIDTLLVFAGLYSAVLSAFLVESYHSLLQDPDDKIVSLLSQLVSQSYSVNGRFLNSTDPIPRIPTFEAPEWAITVNTLWFASLVISLAVASLGMLVKQWLREFLAMEYMSPQERLRARQYRQPSLARWRVYEIAAVLPLLLQISLGIFLVGLCYFTAQVHARVLKVTLPLVCAWAFFISMTTLAPLINPKCPFKTTFLIMAMKFARRWIVFPILQGCHSIVRIICRLLRLRCARVFARQRLERTPEEEDIVRNQQDNTEILLAVDAIMAGTGVLPSVINAYWYQGTEEAEKAIDFALNLVSHRVIVIEQPQEGLKILPSAPDLRTMSKPDWAVFTGFIADNLFKNQIAASKCPIWAQNAVILLLSATKHDLEANQIQQIRPFLTPQMLASVFPSITNPYIGNSAVEMKFLLRVLRCYIGQEGPIESLVAPLESMELDHPVWALFASRAVNLLETFTGVIGLDDTRTPWVKDALFLLLSTPSPTLPDSAREVMHNLLIDVTALRSHLDSSTHTLLLADDPVCEFNISQAMKLIHLVTGRPPRNPIPNLTNLQPVTRESLLQMVGMTLARHRNVDVLKVKADELPPWIPNAAILLLVHSEHPITVPPVASEELRRWIAHPGMLDTLLQAYFPDPSFDKRNKTFGFLLRLLERCLGISPDRAFNHKRIHDLSVFNEPQWRAFSNFVANLMIKCKTLRLHHEGPHILRYGALLLMSKTSHELPDESRKVMSKIAMRPDGSLLTLFQCCTNFHENANWVEEAVWVARRIAPLVLSGHSSNADPAAPTIAAWRVLAEQLGRALKDVQHLGESSSLDTHVQAICLLVSHPGYVLLPSQKAILKRFLQEDSLLILLERLRQLLQKKRPADLIWALLTLISCSRANSPAFPSRNLPATIPSIWLESFSPKSWNALISLAVDTINLHGRDIAKLPVLSEKIDVQVPLWVVDATIIFLSSCVVDKSVPLETVRTLRRCFQMIPILPMLAGRRISRSTLPARIHKLFLQICSSPTILKACLDFFAAALRTDQAQEYRSVVSVLQNAAQSWGDTKRARFQELWMFLVPMAERLNLTRLGHGQSSEQVLPTILTLSRCMSADDEHYGRVVAILARFWEEDNGHNSLRLLCTVSAIGSPQDYEELCIEAFMAAKVTCHMQLLAMTLDHCTTKPDDSGLPESPDPDPMTIKPAWLLRLSLRILQRLVDPESSCTRCYDQPRPHGAPDHQTWGRLWFRLESSIQRCFDALGSRTDQGNQDEAVENVLRSDREMIAEARRVADELRHPISNDTSRSSKDIAKLVIPDGLWSVLDKFGGHTHVS